METAWRKQFYFQQGDTTRQIVFLNGGNEIKFGNIKNTSCIGVRESSSSDAVGCGHTAEIAGKGRLSEAAAHSHFQFMVV
eukprot:6180943-Pleurochrysis_carterae.AAC.1